MSVGPVLSVEDTFGNKVGAAYGRLKPRDFIDAIRQSGQFSEERLLELAAERDDGFEPDMYAQQIRQVARIPDRRSEAYGVTRSSWNSFAIASPRGRTPSRPPEPRHVLRTSARSR